MTLFRKMRHIWREEMEMSKSASKTLTKSDDEEEILCDRCGIRIKKGAAEVITAGGKRYLACETCARGVHEYFTRRFRAGSDSEGISEDTWRRYQKLTNEKEGCK